MSGKPDPATLWEEAGGDSEKYRELMVQHGHLVPRPPVTREGILEQIRQGAPDVQTPEGKWDYIFMRYVKAFGIARLKTTGKWYVVAVTMLEREYLFPLPLDTQKEANSFRDECVAAYRELEKTRGWDHE